VVSLLDVSPELVIDLSFCHIIIPKFSLEVLALFYSELSQSSEG
jgi:hypothetical protein